MSENKTIRLEAITTKIGSGATPRGGAEAYKESGITLIRSMNVYDSVFLGDGLAFIDDDQADGLRNVIVEPNDVLLNITGASVARCCMVPRSVLPARVNQHVAILRADKAKADPRFVCYCLVSPRYKDELLSIAQGGATREALTKEKIQNFEIPDLPLATQRKIASILSAYDDLIENNTRRIAILEEMAQAIYREWFVNFRFPGHENVKLVDSPLGQLPEGWEVSTLGSCGQVIPGYAFKSKDWQESGVPVVKIKNITDDNCIDMESADCVSASLISERMQKFMLETGDLLIAMTGATAGKAGVLRMRVPSALNQRVAKISPKDGFRSLLWCFLIGNRQLFFNLADGAAQPNMSGGQIESVSVLVPAENVLSMFESCVADIAQLADSLYFKNRNLRTTRDLLLPKLISGKLDVEDLDIDVGMTAEALVEATA